MAYSPRVPACLSGLPLDRIGTVALGVIGLTLLGTGVGLAATGHHASFTQVGASNVSMVLALTGAILLVGTAFAIYKVKETKTRDTYRENSLRFILPAIAGLTLTTVSYVGVHIGIGSAFPASLSVDASLAAQGVISFLLGAAITVAVAGVGYRFMKNRHMLDQKLPTIPRTAAIATAVGFLCAASTTLGPKLADCMGIAAANAAEKITMEVMLSFAITSLTWVISIALYNALKPERYVEQNDEAHRGLMVDFL